MAWSWRIRRKEELAILKHALFIFPFLHIFGRDWRIELKSWIALKSLFPVWCLHSVRFWTCLLNQQKVSVTESVLQTHVTLRIFMIQYIVSNFRKEHWEVFQNAVKNKLCWRSKSFPKFLMRTLRSSKRPIRYFKVFM